MQPPTDAQQEQTIRSFACRGSPWAWTPLLGVAFCQGAEAKQKVGGVEHLVPPGYEGVSLPLSSDQAFSITDACPSETDAVTTTVSANMQT